MGSSPPRSSPGWIFRVIPFAASMRGYRPAWLRRDVLGALTVTALLLVLGVVASAALGLHARGVAVVGNIPAGLAPPRLPDVAWKDLLILIPGAAGIALVAFAEAVGPARMFASRHGYEVDANRELVGLGAANMGAGLFQGFSIGCSLSKSAANDEGWRSSLRRSSARCPRRPWPPS